MRLVVQLLTTAMIEAGICKVARIGNIPLRLFVTVANIAFFISACYQATDEADGPAPSVPAHIRSPTLLPETATAQLPDITITQARAIYSSPSTVSVPIRSSKVSPAPARTHTPGITLVSSQGIAPSATNDHTVTPTPGTWSLPTSTPQHSYSGQQIDEWYDLIWKPSLPWMWGSHIRHEDGLIGLSISCENKVESTLQALEGVGIPSDAIRIEVIKSPRHDILPPPPPIFECVPPEVVAPVTGISEPGFGGLYVEHEVATVYMLEPSEELAESLVRDELGDAGFDALSEVRVLKGEYTWDQLLKWHQLIETYRYETIRDGTDDINWGWALLNPRNNRITINVLPPETALTGDGWFVRGIEEALLKLGVPREAVIFVNVW